MVLSAESHMSPMSTTETISVTFRRHVGCRQLTFPQGFHSTPPIPPFFAGKARRTRRTRREVPRGPFCHWVPSGSSGSSSLPTAAGGMPKGPEMRICWFSFDTQL
jgi:hypothetical protein